jgi:hypothetical protein
LTLGAQQSQWSGEGGNTVKARRVTSSRKSTLRRAALLAVISAVVWGYDAGAAVAAVVVPRPPTFEQLFVPHWPAQPPVLLIPTHVQDRIVLQ